MANTGNDMNGFKQAADAMAEFQAEWKKMLESDSYKNATKYPIMTTHPMCGCEIQPNINKKLTENVEKELMKGLMGYVGQPLDGKKLTMRSIEETTKRIIDEFGKPHIQWNHDHSKPIGRLIRTGVGEYTFDFIPDITPKEIKIDIKVEDVGTGTCVNKLIEGLTASGYFDKELKRPKKIEWPSLDREFTVKATDVLPYEELMRLMKETGMLLTTNEKRQMAGIGQIDHSIGFKFKRKIDGVELQECDRIMMGVDFGRDSEPTAISMFKVIDGKTLEQIQLSKKSDDMSFTAWQAYLMKLACSTYGIGPSIINNVNEQKSRDMSSVAIKITNNAEFRGVEKYLLIGGAYWNGKTKNEVYNDGKVLYFNEQGMKGHRTTDERYPSHYYITLSQDDLQMNMYEGTSAAEQSIRRAGYMMINATQFKSVVTVSQEAEHLMERMFSGMMMSSPITRGMQVDLYPLFNRNNFAPDDYRKNVTEESGKKKSAPLPYIDMFEVADIVNTTTKTTVTKLLAAMGAQNTKKSSGICLSDKSIKSITK